MARVKYDNHKVKSYELSKVKGVAMRHRIAFSMFFGLLSLAFVPGNGAEAGWPWKHTSGVDYARNNTWPQPFRGADANSVVAPFEVMRNNGWRENNTLSSALFSKENCLSDAGNLKIQWILTQAPQSQRVIYVKSGKTTEETDARVESVQIAVSGLVPTGSLPQILITDIEPSTSSGAYQTLVNRALIRTTPTPRLPQFTSLNAPSQQSVAPNASQAGTTSSGGQGK